MKNWVKILNRYLTKEYMQMENKPKRNAKHHILLGNYTLSNRDIPLHI